MPITLKGKILEVTKNLRKAEKTKLAQCIENNWNKTALAYSTELNFWRPKLAMEKELLSAFRKELERLGHEGIFNEEILDSINKRRVLQTGPHLGATESPRMLCINWLGSLGVPNDEFYVVGMFSGIPFSNRSRPGRINKKGESINLFPSIMQDGLVYRSTISKKLIESLENAPANIARHFPKAIVGQSYTKWAIDSCQHIERKILKKHNLVYLDINEVVTEYLLQVLHNRFHVIHKLFFDEKTRKEFMKIFPNEIMFYTPVFDGKYEKMENMVFHGHTLKSKSAKIDLSNSGILIKELKEGRLCPALITSFLILAFINEFKCFGSFAQVEYLPTYQEKLAKLKFIGKYDIAKIPTSNLTTGVFPEKADLYPIDILTSDKKFKPNEKALFGELLLPMKNVLLESYFTGDQRKQNENKK